MVTLVMGKYSCYKTSRNAGQNRKNFKCVVHTHTHTHTQGKLTEGKHKEVARNKNEIMIQSYYLSSMEWMEGFPGGSVGKELACNAGDAGDLGSILGSGRSPGGGHSNPLQDSCLENPMDRGAWRATVHRSRRVRHDWSDWARHSTSWMKWRSPILVVSSRIES